MKKSFFLTGVATFCLVLLPIQSQARPVSYPGGITAMTMNNGDSIVVSLNNKT